MNRRSLVDIRHFLHAWDKANRSEREGILTNFVKECENMTCTDIETYFCDCSSLFLARITAWLRITYMFGTSLKIQLQALHVFISASINYLMEFIEVGGVLTLLEIASLKSANEEDKAEALSLLSSIASKGRQYKELICESYGIKVIAECLANYPPTVQENAYHLLCHLSMSNPRFQSLVYKALIDLLPSSSHNAQRLAAIALRQMQPAVGFVSTSIVEPVLQLLKTLHSEVQQEVDLLIHEVLKYEEIHQSMLLGLVTLLKPEDIPRSKITTEPLKTHLQQAGAARIISSLISDEAIGTKLIELNIIPHLLFALSNTAYPESQRQALKCLQLLMSHYVTVKELINVLVGDDLFAKLQSSPGLVLNSLSMDDVDKLVGCLINQKT